MVTKKQISKTFLDLVAIDSPSGQESKVATYIISYLRKIGVKATRDKYKNVIASIKGNQSMDPLIFCAHMDTVEPGRGIKAVIKNDTIRSDGNTILAADDKAAIAEILEAVRYLKQKNFKHRPLELVFTREEETIFGGASNLDYRKLKSKDALVLDYSLAPGAIVQKSPFIYIFDIVIRGRAAHSGSFPEKGISAIEIASAAIAELKLGRINQSTIANIGTMKSGLARNVIPEYAELSGEVRSFRQESAQRQLDIINRAFKKAVRKYKATLNFKIKLDCRGYSHKKSNPLIKDIQKTNKALGIKSVFLSGGGASDANVLNHRGINTVVISKGGRNPHSTKEYIKISEMQKVLEQLIEISI